MLHPAPELPDDTPIENVRISTRVRNALTTAGLKTVGEIRAASDATLLSLPDLGKGVCRSSSGDVGPSLNRWGQALGQKAHLIC